MNDMATYENVTRASGPAMTWSMFAINYLDVGLTDKAQIYFEKAYKSYVRPEFKVRQPSFYRFRIIFILYDSTRLANQSCRLVGKKSIF